MFFEVLGRLFGRSKSVAQRGQHEERDKILEKAGELIQSGDRRGAIATLREALEIDPSCVTAHNDLGACLLEIGDMAGAAAEFECAYALDDTFLPAAVNHAKVLCDARRSDDAMPLLENAKFSNADFAATDAIYASARLHLGDIRKARHFQLRAWLGEFDSLRIANAHLFFASYDDLDQAQLAAEHRFWASTLRPAEALDRLSPAPLATFDGRRSIRIGYWSPDFRRHSVRYFFRPLLESHDRDRFEVFLYHDAPNEDEQTDLIRQAADHFHEVNALPDAALFELIRSHRLDILVELTGHTSNNRLQLLGHRFATVQMSALGYPPTTGLATLDGKLMDRHTVGDDPGRFYTERPMVLPSSFWCFDPKEEATIASDPPVVRVGRVTFGCVGNIAKINPRMLAAWKTILDAVPDSRLLIRAINFEDSASYDVLSGHLAAAGLDLDRIDLRRPEAGRAYFESYNDIDIILDTYPFNGGTTTCFATYMGVPVVSLYGESLISRMGLSILSNLDAADLAQGSEEAYAQRAIALAGDRDYLTRFKREARDRYRNGCLGNGAMFTREFEAACIALLERAATARPTTAATVAEGMQVRALPPDELVRRAYFVLRTGQDAAARRILDHCLAEYPDCGAAHVVVAQQWASEQRFDEAIDYLHAKLPTLRGDDWRAAQICLARFHLLEGQVDEASRLCRDLLDRGVDDVIDRLQVELFRSCLDIPAAAAPPPAVDGVRRIAMVLPVDSAPEFAAQKTRLLDTCRLPPGWTLSIERCDEVGRISGYRAALQDPAADICVFVQKNIELLHPDFALEVAAALSDADVVGFAGARRWTRLDWRLDSFEEKAAGFCLDLSEKPGFHELRWLGTDRSRTAGAMAILDGAMLAVSREAAQRLALADRFDDELLGSDTLLEEAWTHSAHREGARLAVHRNLGILVRTSTDLDTRYRQLSRIHQARSMGFDAFAVLKDDRIAVSVPIPHLDAAIATMDAFIADSRS